jgi:hypothetical protein
MVDDGASSIAGREPPAVLDGDDGAIEPPLDPRILALAGVIGRLIARERFGALLAAETQSPSEPSR